MVDKSTHALFLFNFFFFGGGGGGSSGMRVCKLVNMWVCILMCMYVETRAGC